MGKKHKKFAWNKKSGKIVSTKYLKERTDISKEKEDTSDRMKVFVKKFDDAIRNRNKENA